MTSKVTFRLTDGHLTSPVDSINDVSNGNLKLPFEFRSDTTPLKKYLNGDIFDSASGPHVVLNNHEFEATLALRQAKTTQRRHWVLEDLDTGTTFRMYSRYFFEMLSATPVQFEVPIPGVWTCSVHGGKFGLKFLERK